MLALIGTTLTLAGMFFFRRFMAERSIAYVVGFLTVVGTLLSLPIIGMYYGLHDWTAAPDRRRRRCALHRRHRYGAGVASGPDRDDSDAGLDRQLGTGTAQGDLFRGHGLVHQPGLVARSSAPST